jgi:hypothetical protein
MLNEIYTTFFPINGILDVEKVNSVDFDLNVNNCLADKTEIHEIKLDHYAIYFNSVDDYSTGIKKLIYESQRHITSDFINFIDSRSEKINISSDKPEYKFLKKNLKFNLSKKKKGTISKAEYLYNVIEKGFYELIIDIRSRLGLDFSYIIVSPNFYDLIYKSKSFSNVGKILEEEVNYNGPFVYNNSMLITPSLNICFFVNKHQEDNIIYLGLKTHSKDLYLFYFQNIPHIILDGKIKTYGVDLHYKIYETEKHKYKKIILE